MKRKEEFEEEFLLYALKLLKDGSELKGSRQSLIRIESITRAVYSYFLEKSKSTNNLILKDIADIFLELQNKSLSYELGKKYKTFAKNRAIGTLVDCLVIGGSSANCSYKSVAAWLNISAPQVKSCHKNFSVFRKDIILDKNEPSIDIVLLYASISYPYVYEYLFSSVKIKNFPNYYTKGNYVHVKDVFDKYWKYLEEIEVSRENQPHLKANKRWQGIGEK